MRVGEEGPNPDKSRPRGVGLRRVVGRGEEECLSVGYRQILSQLVIKIVFHILEGQQAQATCVRGFFFWMQGCKPTIGQ